MTIIQGPIIFLQLLLETGLLFYMVIQATFHNVKFPWFFSTRHAAQINGHILEEACW